MEGNEIIKDDDGFRLNIAFIHMIGKYFKDNNDFINITKTCKKYKDLIELYLYNPISNPELFENMQTQNIYKIDDIYNIKDGMYRYYIDHDVFDTELQDNDFFKIKRRIERPWIFKTGYKYGIDEDCKDNHQYVTLNDNIILREQSFPIHIIWHKDDLNLDNYYVAYDTFDNPIGNIGKEREYKYHTDTLDAKKILTPDDCIIYIHFGEFLSIYIPLSDNRRFNDTIYHYALLEGENNLIETDDCSKLIYDPSIKKYIRISNFEDAVVFRIVILKKRNTDN